ncbi:hypothetical protein CAEBREN_11277 [Caenorhabditis brenneri]|uniref:CWH43-like N-terminal domain-containing protein n=1 Tax=Caenorhabditis brenneri TaxID=135651 RepID=G0NHG5_CAEBE|nr:hypothetical protein CAEBREN_11277 [Caenorhabditis brenneri]
MPAAGVVMAFLLGYSIHTVWMYDYPWGCRNVYLPSVSRLLNLPLERIMWNFLSLSSVPLQLMVVLRQYILTFSTSNKLQFLRLVMVISSVFQSIFLTLLATVGERESGDFHVAFFSGFAVSTIINYSVFTILMRFTGKKENPKHSRRRVTVLLGLMITLPTIFIAFILHNVFCVAGAYEAFAIFEYLTIILIYAFHVTNFYLFSDPSLRILICQRNGKQAAIRI